MAGKNNGNGDDKNKGDAEAKKADPLGTDNEALVQMIKDGAQIGVDPSCVKAHEKVGWKRKEQP